MDIVCFDYTNHRGESARRTVRPIRIWFGSTAWHPEAQWFLEAWDIDRNATRDFALNSIAGWTYGRSN